MSDQHVVLNGYAVNTKLPMDSMGFRVQFRNSETTNCDYTEKIRKIEDRALNMFKLPMSHERRETFEIVIVWLFFRRMTLINRISCSRNERYMRSKLTYDQARKRERDNKRTVDKNRI